jgi:hypothetical protein
MAISPNQLNTTVSGNPYDPYIQPFDPNAISITSQNLIGSWMEPEDFVQGEMLNSQIVVSDSEMIQMMTDPDNFKQTMKKRLAEIIAEKLLENKLVEFTKQEDLHTNETVFRARAYLVKDDKVRTLRKVLK